MLEILVLTLVGVATLIYWLVNRRYSYWLSKGVVQPPTQFGFGHFKDAYLGRDNVGMVMENIYKSYPNNDAVGIYELLTPKLVVKNPELVKQVMAGDFSSFHDNEYYVLEKNDPYIYLDPFFLRGNEWKLVRTSLIPLLTQIRMKEIYPLLIEVVNRLDVYVHKNLENELEMKDLATLYSMDVISSSVFGISSNCFTDPNAAFRKMGDLQMKDQLQGWKLIVTLRLPKIRDILGFKFVPIYVAEYIRNMVFSVVDHRRKNNVVRNDLMQHMMKLNLDVNSNLLMGQAMVFFVEGFETSSMVSSSALYELAINQSIQETLFEELNNSFGDKGDIDLDTLGALPYLEKVVQETMRKYVIMYVFQRLCTKDTSMEIDGNVVDIKKGTPVWVPVYSIHHDPQYYPNPEVFDPERFNADAIASRPSYTYMPLGEGPRICVGYRMGLTQVKLFIAHLVRKYKVLPTEKTPLKLTLDPGAWLVVPKEDRWVKFQTRIKKTI